MDTLDLTNCSFDDWLEELFNHPTDEHQEWYWELDILDPPPRVCIEFITRAFEEADRKLLNLDEQRLRNGLNYVLSSSCSDHIVSLYNESVDLKAKLRCIRSFYNLFETCFYKKCTPHLLHRDEHSPSPLNQICYMWWDLYPGYGQPHDTTIAELDREILEVMKKTLALNSVALRENALHGLGHWQPYYPNAVQGIIDRFLEQNMAIRQELRDYAMEARIGDIA